MNSFPPVFAKKPAPPGVPRSSGLAIPPACASRFRGAALVLVLGAIVLVSLALTAVIRLTQHSANESRLAAQQFQARLIAESGLALGLHPDVKSTDPVLHQELPGGFRLDVVLTSEQGRFAINQVTTAVLRSGLEELFVTWGVSADDAAIAADSLKDWVDPDDNPEPRGAESTFYTAAGFEEYPANEPFTSLEQMLLVQGMAAVAKQKPDWRSSFTLYGDGKIDANAASPEIMHAFAGIPLSNAELFVSTRNGPDGVLGTEDDQLYESSNAQEAVQLLGVPQERIQELGQYFTLEGTARRVESRATVADLTYSLVVIADRASGSVLSRRWK